MLVTFLPIFVPDTKIISGHNFGDPLMIEATTEVVL